MKHLFNQHIKTVLGVFILLLSFSSITTAQYGDFEGAIKTEFAGTSTNPHIEMIQTLPVEWSRIHFKNSDNLANRWNLAGRMGSTVDNTLGWYYNSEGRVVYNEATQQLTVQDNILLTDAGDNPDLTIEVTGNGTGELNLIQPGVANGGASLSLDAGEDLMRLSTSSTSNTGLTMATGSTSPNFGLGTLPSGTHKLEIQMNSFGGTAPGVQLNLKENNNSDFSRLQFSQNGVDQYWHIAGKSAPTGFDSDLNFYFHNGTSGTNVLRLDGDEGYVGANIAPETEFHVGHGAGTFERGLTIENTVNGNWWKFYANSGSNTLTLTRSGNTGSTMGTFGTGGIYTASDMRLKENVVDLPYSISNLMKLDAKAYNYISERETGVNSIGFIAQDVEKIFPELVIYDTEADQYSLNYGGMSVVAVQAIQDQQIIIEDQQSQIDNLKKELEEIKTLLKK